MKWPNRFIERKSYERGIQDGRRLELDALEPIIKKCVEPLALFPSNRFRGDQPTAEMRAFAVLNNHLTISHAIARGIHARIHKIFEERKKTIEKGGQE